jgi:N-acetylglucosamine-6-phosphate deacetylase
LKTAFTAAEVFTPISTIYRPVVVVEDGRITAMGPRQRTEVPADAKVVDLGDAILAPGYIDVHIHGSAGHDVMADDDAALPAIAGFLCRRGVTSYCPTTVTAPIDKTLQSLERLGLAIAAAKKNAPAKGARPIGIHLEGPFISTKKCGVHPVAEIVPPSNELFDRMWMASGGTVQIVTIAPELPGAATFIRELSSRGVRMSLGHSDADTASAKAAVAAGARHATHTFNAMRPLDHREPGILGVVLSDDHLSADIIADGVHLSPEIVKLFLAVKGEERAVLITDAISATGMPDGVYKLGGFEVQVKGSVCMAGGRLAGSVLTMDLAVRNIMTMAQWRLQQAVRLASLNPARLLGIDTERGLLAVGRHADMVALSPQGDVIKTIIAGNLCG